MARYKARLIAEGENSTVIVEGRAVGQRVVRDITHNVADEDVPMVVRAAMDRVRSKVEPE